MESSKPPLDMEAYGFAYEKTIKTVLGALANSDTPGRELVIKNQKDRIKFYEKSDSPDSQGKADAIRDALKRFKGQE